jgi:hypothetical protein
MSNKHTPGPIPPAAIAVNDLLRANGIEYKATFVPQSISRNAGAKEKR